MCVSCQGAVEDAFEARGWWYDQNMTQIGAPPLPGLYKSLRPKNTTARNEWQTRRATVSCATDDDSSSLHALYRPYESIPTRMCRSPATAARRTRAGTAARTRFSFKRIQNFLRKHAIIRLNCSKLISADDNMNKLQQQTST